MAHIVGAQTAATVLQAYIPNPVISSTSYSSFAPASWFFVPWDQPASVAVKNIVVLNSFNAAAPGATSQASTATNRHSYFLGATIFTRQNYGTGSTNLSQYTTASFGLTAGLSYSSTSQSFVMSWVTDSTGGTSSMNTTSNDAGWSNFITGAKYISIPLLTTLSAGEYWLAFQHSSTSGSTGSNITLLSNSLLQQAWPAMTLGTLGASASAASLNPAGLGNGVASAVTTNATMGASVISASVQPYIFFALSNA